MRTFLRLALAALVSTVALVGTRSVEARPMFLCPEDCVAVDGCLYCTVRSTGEQWVCNNACTNCGRVNSSDPNPYVTCIGTGGGTSPQP
jgi:hypothetical protein